MLLCSEMVLAIPVVLFRGRALRMSVLSSCSSVARPYFSDRLLNPVSGALNGVGSEFQRIPNFSSFAWQTLILGQQAPLEGAGFRYPTFAFKSDSKTLQTAIPVNFKFRLKTCS